MEAIMAREFMGVHHRQRHHPRRTLAQVDRRTRTSADLRTHAERGLLRPVSSSLCCSRTIAGQGAILRRTAAKGLAKKQAR